MKKGIIALPVIILIIASTSTTVKAQGFSALLDKIDNLEAKVNLLEGKINSAGNQSGAPQFESRLATLEQKLAALSENKTDLEKFNTQLTSLENSSEDSQLSLDLKHIEDSVAELTLRVSELENGLVMANTEDSGIAKDQELRDKLSDFKVAGYKQNQGANYYSASPDITGQLTETAPELGEDSGIQSPNASSNPAISGDRNDLDIGGFVDASYFYDVPSKDNTFGFDQTEIDIEKSLGEEGSIRIDLEWVNDGLGGFNLNAEQGYVTYSPLALKSSEFSFGKFNAPIGFELLDPHEMYQFSHALVFNYGLPTNLTGLMINTELETDIDLKAYITNGWDENFDFNQNKTFGGRLGYSPNEMWAVGFSAIAGDQDESLNETTVIKHKLTVIDADLTITPNNKLTIGGEYNRGTDQISDSTYKWSGFLAMFHYDINDLFGFTMRYDYFNDDDGTRLDFGISEKRTALTLCPTFSLGNGMGALIEFRIDMSDKEVFLDGNDEPSKNRASLAFEMTYSF